MKEKNFLSSRHSIHERASNERKSIKIISRDEWKKVTKFGKKSFFSKKAQKLPLLNNFHQIVVE
jgi:hypothetical protein